MSAKQYNAMDFEQEAQSLSLLDNQIGVWSLGNAGLVVKSPQTNEWIVVDPYLTRSIEENKPGTEFVRAYDPPFQPQQLKGASAVLITHHHDDHLDFSTLVPLQECSQNTKFYVPRPHLDLCLQNNLKASRCNGVREGDTFEVAGMTIAPINAAHTNYDKDDNGDCLYLGYLLEAAGLRIYIAGDTVITDRIVEQVSDFAPDVVIVPINGRDYFRTERQIQGNMTYREGVDLAITVGARTIIPVHYDLFPNNTENPSYFVDYLLTRSESLNFKMLRPGEGTILARR